MSEKVLCVDDDSRVLDAYRRGLRKQFAIDTALGGEEALSAIDSQGPYAVVVSDMRMPGMDGVRLLGKIRQQAPDTVRIMLTGNADLQTAIEAVNEGNIFRFLTKPCPPETLAKSLTAGVRQYQLVMTEKELLEKTFRGSIKVLIEVLSLINPTAFGHASRVRRLVHKMCGELKADNAWQCEVAAMLSQIGYVTIPTETLEKVHDGRELKANEMEMLEAHPSVGRNLIVNIPRLECVAEAIGYQNKRFDGSGEPSDAIEGKDIPIGARILKVALDYDTLRWSGSAEIDAMVELRKRSGWYDPVVLRALEAVIGFDEAFEFREVMVQELSTLMTLAEDIRTTDGTIVVGKGQEVTTSLCQRVKNFARNRHIKEPFRVFVRSDRHARVLTRT